MRESVSKVVRLFQVQENEPENSHYSKWFPNNDGRGKGNSSGTRESVTKTKTKTKSAGATRGGVARGFNIVKTAAGFKVIPDSEGPPAIGTKVVLKAGYAQIRGGSPLSKSADDFELKNQGPNVSGVKFMNYDLNHLSFTVDKKNFELEFSNFDKYRDLVIGVVRAN
jgi:hypothetical protein